MNKIIQPIFYVFFLCLVCFFLQTLVYAHDSLTGEQIIQNYKTFHQSHRDEDIVAKVIVKYKNDFKKYYKVQIKNLFKTSNQNYAASSIQFIAPDSVKGTTFVNLQKDSASENWVHLPAVQKTKQIEGFENEIPIHQFFSLNTDHYDIKRLKYDGAYLFYVIELQSKKDSRENISKKIVWLRKKDFTLTKIESYDANQQLIQKVLFSDIKKVSKTILKSYKIEIQDLKNEKMIEILIEKIKLDQNFRMDDFKL